MSRSSIVYLNGNYLPEHEAMVSVFDRGFLYGDGLFETMPVRAGKPIFWELHMRRMRDGADHLGIKFPVEAEVLLELVARLLRENAVANCTLRVNLSRGSGRRGYSPAGANRPTLVMCVHPADHSNARRTWRLVTAPMPLPTGGELHLFKTTNKLVQILAKAFADEHDAEEALLINSEGLVAEGTASNVFCLLNGIVCTPGIDAGALPGITRHVLVEICHQNRIPLEERRLSVQDVFGSEGVFLTLSTLGIVEATSLNGVPLARSPLTPRLANLYDEVVRSEALKSSGDGLTSPA